MDVVSRLEGIFNFQNDLHLFGFVFSRRKYEMTDIDITFKSIADLRRELPSQVSLSTLQLIKSFVEKNKNENENRDFVRFAIDYF